MNVGELRKLIRDLPDDTLVVVPGSDHSYYEATAGTAKAEIERHGTRRGGHISHISEYYDEEHRSTPDPHSRVETVLVVGA